MSPQLVVAALAIGALYALIALGLNLVYGTMRLLNVAHGEIIMIGAYVAYWLFTLFHLGPLVSAVVAVGLTAGLGAAVYLGLFRPMLRPGPALERLEANSLLVFFGVSVILQNVASLLFTGNLRGYQHLDELVSFGGATIALNRLVVFAVASSVCLAAVLFLRFSMAGLAIRALIQQRDAASLVGIPVGRINLLSFCLGFGIAGLTGVLVSLLEQVSPFMGFPFTIAAFVVIILGGLGNLMGSLVGGLLIGVLETIGVALTGPSYRSVMLYGLFVLVLLLRPQGLFGRRAART